MCVRVLVIIYSLSCLPIAISVCIKNRSIFEMFFYSLRLITLIVLNCLSGEICNDQLIVWFRSAINTIREKLLQFLNSAVTLRYNRLIVLSEDWYPCVNLSALNFCCKNVDQCLCSPIYVSYKLHIKFR